MGSHDERDHDSCAIGLDRNGIFFLCEENGFEQGLEGALLTGVSCQHRPVIRHWTRMHCPCRSNIHHFVNVSTFSSL